MNQIVHLIRTDIRRLRWPLVAWVLVLSLTAVISIVHTNVWIHSHARAQVLSDLSGVALTLQVLMFAAFVSLLVHSDPLVGADGFWLTRPIDARALMTAKLMLGVVALVFLPMFGEAVVVAALGLGLSDGIRSMPAFFIVGCLDLLILFAVASVTRSLAQFLLVLVFGTVAIILMLILAGSVLTGFGAPSLVVTSVMVAPVTLICGSAAVLVLQYLTRRTRAAVATGIVTIGAALMLPYAWPFTMAAEIEAGSWSRDASRTPAILVEAEISPRRPGEWPVLAHAPGSKDVVVPIDLRGMPPDHSVESLAIRNSVLEMPGGEKYTAGSQTMHYSIRDEDQSRAPSRNALQAALGSERLLSRNPDDWRIGLVFTINEADYERYARQPWRLISTIDFVLKRTAMVGAIPVSEGAVLRHERSSITIVHVDVMPGRRRVVVRERSLPSSLQAPPSHDYAILLRNRAKHEAIFADREPGVGRLMVWFGEGEMASDGQVTTTILVFPQSDTPVDDAWLAGADLLVVETKFAGRVTRTLDVDHVVARPSWTR